MPEFTNEFNTLKGADELINVLSAIRGPDSTNFPILKHLFVAPIRGLLFTDYPSEIYSNLEDKIGGNDDELWFLWALNQWLESPPHWRGHIIQALETIVKIFPKGNTRTDRFHDLQRLLKAFDMKLSLCVTMGETFFDDFFKKE